MNDVNGAYSFRLTTVNSLCERPLELRRFLLTVKGAAEADMSVVFPQGVPRIMFRRLASTILSLISFSFQPMLIFNAFVF